MNNPFRTRYRIVEHMRKDQPFEPQVLRWYWPIWQPLDLTTCTGFDTSPVVFRTKVDAQMAIEYHRTPKSYKTYTIHEVD